MISKEISKFLAGVALWETMVHIVMMFGNFIPVTLFGFTITQNLNTVLIVIPAILTSLLVYYAWFRK